MSNQPPSFEDWLASVLPQSPLPGVVAYNFNMAECGDWIVEVVGASSYSATEHDWCCPPEAWTCRPSEYILSRDALPDWQRALEHVVRRVSKFIQQSPLPGAVVLRHSQAVCVGFVDGDLTPVWPKPRLVRQGGG